MYLRWCTSDNNGPKAQVSFAIAAIYNCEIECVTQF